MSDLTRKLAEAGLPSEAAVAVAHDGLGQGATRREAYRQLLVTDAPAILRVLLEARLAEMGEVEMALLAWELGNTSGAPTLQATLLRLLAPEVTE